MNSTRCFWALGLSITGALALPVIAGDTQEKPNEKKPAPTTQERANGLAEGDRFRIDLSYKNAWWEAPPILEGGGPVVPVPKTSPPPSHSPTPTIHVPPPPTPTPPPHVPPPPPPTPPPHVPPPPQPTPPPHVPPPPQPTPPPHVPPQQTAPPARPAPTPQAWQPPTAFPPGAGGAGGFDDPLEVNATLHGRVGKDGRVTFWLSVVRVHYHDSLPPKPTKWTIDPSSDTARDDAGRLVDAVSAHWREQFAARLDRDTDENQLLGAALVLLHGASFDAVLARGRDPKLDPALEASLPARLGAKYPAVLYDNVLWFVREACRRVLAPAPPPKLGPADFFEAEGVEYRLADIPSGVVGLDNTKKGSRDAITGLQGLAGEKPSAAVDLVKSRKDKVLLEGLAFDTVTGLVLEGFAQYRSGTVYQPNLQAGYIRASLVRWDLALRDFARGGEERPPAASKPPERTTTGSGGR